MGWLRNRNRTWAKLLDACEFSEVVQMLMDQIRNPHLGLVLMDSYLLLPAPECVYKDFQGDGELRMSSVAPIWSPCNKAFNCTILHEQLEKSLGVWVTTSMSWVCYLLKFHLAITCLLMCSAAYGLALLSDSWDWKTEAPAIYGSLALDCLCSFWFLFDWEDRKQASLCVWLSMHFGDGCGSGCVVLYNTLSV